MNFVFFHVETSCDFTVRKHSQKELRTVVIGVNGLSRHDSMERQDDLGVYVHSIILHFLQLFGCLRGYFDVYFSDDQSNLTIKFPGFLGFPTIFFIFGFSTLTRVVM